MIRAFVAAVLMAAPAGAETARLLSGEHGAFTRLVIELPAATPWTVGRTEGGYGFAVTDAEQPGYDTAPVWQRIDRSRLTELGVDPQSGALQLTLGCDCHVFPFEYQPGIVVLDIKPGPAPAGSAFEAALADPAAAALPAQSAALAPGYDWLSDRDAVGKPEPASRPLPLPLATDTVSLKPLHDELLEQIARGAADGTINMELPGRPRPTDPVDRGELPWSNIRIGDEPGVELTQPGALVASETVPSTCIDPARLDIASWSEGRLPHEILPLARASLYGEFDIPDPDAVLAATRGLLHLGFGAEALQTAALLPSGGDGDDMPIYRSLGRLVDGESDPGTPFADMLGCPGPAALWAALAHDRLPPGPAVNRDAVLQAFVALPAHLRGHLGPGLADKFLALDDAEAARIIRDAIERAPAANPAEVALLDAKSDLHGGNAEAAAAHAETAIELGGDEVASLIALVDAHAHDMTPLPPDIAEALIAHREEMEGTETGPAVERAIVLALALSEQSDAAFDAVNGREDLLPELWSVVLARATDDDFLRHAVLPADAAPPALPADDAVAVAKRLLDLGFPDAAAAWVGQVGPGDAPDHRRIAAGAAFGRGDAMGAVALLEGLDDAEAVSLRAQALLQLGQMAEAQSTFASAGDQAAAARLGPWRNDWNGLDPALAESWHKAAGLVTEPGAEADAGLLARGTGAVEASATSRTAIEALLGSVASPQAE